MTSSVPRSPWFAQSFNDDYRKLYAARDMAQADREVACVVDALGIGASDQVLDLCCGFGRHLRALWRRRLPAVGVDLSFPLLRSALLDTEGERPATPRLVRADMRELPFPGETRGFSVVVNFFTSFGYFETDSEHRRAAQELARILRTGGRFSMDLMNPAPTVRDLVPFSRREVGGLEIVEERRYDASRSRIEKRTRVVGAEPGESREYHESVRVFSLDEMRPLLSGVGLAIDRVLGDFSGRPYAAESPRMILLGSKA